MLVSSWSWSVNHQTTKVLRPVRGALQMFFNFIRVTFFIRKLTYTLDFLSFSFFFFFFVFSRI